MKFMARVLFVVALALLAAEPALFAATVQGTVRNGTTGKPVAGAEVVLIQLQGGMTPVGNSKSDAQGHFTFDHPAIGAQPMLVRAVYKGVNFHQPLPPGRSDVEVEVFDPSRDPKTISVDSHFVIFQPNGGTLVIGEEYAVKNNSQPPQAFYNEKGNFDIALPEGATLKQIAAQGPSGMPVVQVPIDKGKGKYSVAYAFRPGDNGVRYSYELPYSGSAAVKLPTVYPGARLVVVAPPTVQISGEGLQAGGQEQGLNIYDRGTLTPNAVVAVNVSGTAGAVAADTGTQTDPAAQGRDAQPSGGGGQGVSIQVAPGRLDGLKLPVVLVLVVGFAALAFVLARRPVTAVAGAPSSGGSVAIAANPSADSVSSPAGAASAAPAAQASLAQVDAAVSSSLDALKDTLFRLELRRQAGTISEEEYAKERARTEKVLRDLVRG